MKRFLMVVAFVGLALPVLAQDTPPQADYKSPVPSGITHDRKGIVAGFGAGAGEQFLYYNTYNRNSIVPTVDLKLGYGISDKILILFNPSMIYARNDGLTIMTFNFPVAAQFYVFKDLYLRPGVGVSISNRTYNAFLQAQNLLGKATVGADLAVGYEFRLLGGRLGLSPELVYHYTSLPSGYSTTMSNTLGIQLSVMSYFKVK